MAKRISKTKSLDNNVIENVDVVQNKLLGNYNSDGKYIIEKRIVNELVKLKKKEKRNYNSDIFCTAKTSKDEVIDFKISIKFDPKIQENIASLYVLEGVAKQGGKSVNIIQTNIAKYVDKDTKDFRDKVFIIYNVETESDKGRDVKEIDEDNINTRKDFLSKLDQLSYNEINKYYSDYYNARVKILKREGNTYSKDLLDMLKNDISDPVTAMFFKDKKYRLGFNYKAMNEALDNAVEYYSTCPQYSGDKIVFEGKNKCLLDKLGEQVENAIGENGKYINYYCNLEGFPRESSEGVKAYTEIKAFKNRNENSITIIKLDGKDWNNRFLVNFKAPNGKQNDVFTFVSVEKSSTSGASSSEDNLENNVFSKSAMALSGKPNNNITCDASGGLVSEFNYDGSYITTTNIENNADNIKSANFINVIDIDINMIKNNNSVLDDVTDDEKKGLDRANNYLKIKSNSNILNK